PFAACTASTHTFSSGFAAIYLSCTVLVGAMYDSVVTVVLELLVFVRHSTSFLLVPYRPVSFCTGMLTNSPPVGAGAVPPLLLGIGTMPYSKPAFLAFASCQVPFSANAYWPVANSCQLVVWVLVITEFGA